MDLPQREHERVANHPKARHRICRGQPSIAGKADLMAKNEKRPIIKLRSTEGTGYVYVTTKNKVNNRERLELKKYDPVLRRHVMFKEER